MLKYAIFCILLVTTAVIFAAPVKTERNTGYEAERLSLESEIVDQDALATALGNANNVAQMKAALLEFNAKRKDAAKEKKDKANTKGPK